MRTLWASDLDWVVDHPEVQLHAVDLAGDRGVSEAPVMVDKLDQR
jgi:hypothetical protein